MTLRIRLRRTGKSAKKHYHFRVVVADSKSPRDGRFVEEVGFYRPSDKPALVSLDIEKIDSWVKKGAQPSQTVASLIKKAKKETK